MLEDLPSLMILHGAGAGGDGLGKLIVTQISVVVYGPSDVLCAASLSSDLPLPSVCIRSNI